MKEQQHNTSRAIGSDSTVHAARAFVNPTLPVFALVLAAIAVPVEFRSLDAIAISWAVSRFDVVANIMLFVPVGALLARSTFARAVVIAIAMTVAAETAQLFTVYRYPSPIDVFSNVVGAVAGWVAMRRGGWALPRIPLRRATGVAAIMAALALVSVKAALDLELAAETRSDDALIVNRRGATALGSVEAYWSFDSVVASAVADDSGRGLNGVLQGGAGVVPGVRGTALEAREGAHADFGTPMTLRLMGSVTVTAWIKPSEFPRDDAAIVSSQLPGFQLDTTIDRGPRVLAFKLTNLCADLMTRYGTTELQRDRWYHVAGVYDADALTLSVYLDGHKDDGFLRGTITAAQRASARPVYVGARPDLDGFGFLGAIDDVTIHSAALDEREIRTLMEGQKPVAEATSDAQSTAAEVLAQRLQPGQLGCHQPSRPSDTLVPGVAVAVGLLAALALAAFRRTRRVVLVGTGLAVGAALVPIAALESLPAYVGWMLPVLASIGAATIAMSINYDARES